MTADKRRPGVSRCLRGRLASHHHTQQRGERDIPPFAGHHIWHTFLALCRMPRLAVADRPGIHPDASAACAWLAFDSLPPIRPPYLRHLPTHPHTPGAAGPPYATHIATRINHMAFLHIAAIAFPFWFPILPLPAPRLEAVQSPSHPLI